MKTLSSPIVNEIVEELLDKYVGGVKFFDHLDGSWRTPRGYPAVADLVDYAFSEYGSMKFIGSGRFGMFLANGFGYEFESKLLLVTGGLRTTAPMDDLSYMADRIKGYDFVLLDDSFYSGRTRLLIRAEIERLGGRLVKTIVIYDGARHKDPDVEAMFRYYDRYSPDPTQKNPNVKVSAKVPAVPVIVGEPAPMPRSLREALRRFDHAPLTAETYYRITAAAWDFLKVYRYTWDHRIDLEEHMRVFVGSGVPYPARYSGFVIAGRAYVTVQSFDEEGDRYLLENWDKILNGWRPA